MDERILDEVIRQNRLAARTHAEAPFEDPGAMAALETAVGGNQRRIYELGLGRVIARLAEELARMEAELETMRRASPEREPAVAAAREEARC